MGDYDKNKKKSRIYGTFSNIWWRRGESNYMYLVRFFMHY